MVYDHTELDLTVIEKFSGYLEEYIDKCHVEFGEVPDNIRQILSADPTTLRNSPASELDAWAFSLSCYAFALQKELNETKAKRDWCNHVMDHLVAKHYDPSLYVKYEVRRKMAALEVNDEFGTKVEKMYVHLDARVTILSDKVVDVRRMADTLGRMAKRKDYS